MSVGEVGFGTNVVVEVVVGLMSLGMIGFVTDVVVVVEVAMVEVVRERWEVWKLRERVESFEKKRNRKKKYFFFN